MSIFMHMYLAELMITKTGIFMSATKKLGAFERSFSSTGDIVLVDKLISFLVCSFTVAHVLLSDGD